MKIAIDGPSGAGKSTVAKLLAERFDCVYLDTGAMYRAVALAAQRAGIDFGGLTEEKVLPVLKTTEIDVKYSGGVGRIFLGQTDVSEEIRRHAVSKMASDISALPVVRKFLVKIQRELAARTDTVLDGRDIGTYVLPDADFKFYLTASIDERAKRRFLELSAKGEICSLETIKKDIQQRDYNDMNREFSPLRKAADALEIDSSDMTAEDVVAMMTAHIKKIRR